MSEGCAYCDSTDVRARAIVENELAWAVPTNIPITPGHTLVIPKRHVSRLSELSRDELAAISSLAQRIQNALRKQFGAQGFNCAFNEGEVAGQSVPHFHLHVVPRTPGDTGITKYEPREFLYRPGSREATAEAELKEVARQIREAL